MHDVDETLGVRIAPLQIDLDQPLNHVRHVRGRERRTDRFAQPGRHAVHAALVPADLDLVPLLAVLVDAEDADVADMVVAAGVHAARDVDVDLPDVEHVIQVVEAPLDYPIVTYDYAFANRSLVNRAFELRGLAPDVVLTAFDADVIKTYVELGLGVGNMAKMAFDPRRDRHLRAIDASQLFPSSTTRLGIKRGAYLRRFAYDFIQLFAPQLSREVVEKTVAGGTGSSYEL